MAQALAGRMTRDGAPLTVRIDYLTLGPQTGEMLHAGASLDNIQGVAVIGGRETPIRATSSYYSTPVDQTMIERSNRERVSQLTQALTLLDRQRRVLLTARRRVLWIRMISGRLAPVTASLGLIWLDPCGSEPAESRARSFVDGLLPSHGGGGR